MSDRERLVEVMARGLLAGFAPRADPDMLLPSPPMPGREGTPAPMWTRYRRHAESALAAAERAGFEFKMTGEKR